MKSTTKSPSPAASTNPKKNPQARRKRPSREELVAKGFIFRLGKPGGNRKVGRSKYDPNTENAKHEEKEVN